MKSTRMLTLVSAFVAVALTNLFLNHSTEKADAAVVPATALPIPTPTVDSSNSIKVTASGGLRVATFEAKSGRVLLLLPDDMRAGDTISGTIQVEPDGTTEEERAKNLAELNGHTIIITPRPPPGSAQTPDGGIKLPVKEPTFTFGLSPSIVHSVSPFAGFNIALSPPIATGSDPSLTPGGFIQDTFTVVNDRGDPMLKNFRPPPLGQQGRPIEIHGPFDGDASNTTLRFGPSTSTLADFEKGTENVAGGFGVIKPMAESPRKMVFQGPANFAGPVQLFVSDGGKTAIDTHNNLGVKLSAPKTNLMRGERTTLTVAVSGLEGIKEDVPLQLDSKGVITMDGGSFQNLRIKPPEITKDGRYTTTRGITGVQAGGFNVTATVIVRRFDFCLQDDTDPNRIFHFNSFTGDYLFACGGGSCRPGSSTGGTQTGDTTGKPGGTQPGGTPTPPTVPPIALTGIGRPTMKGCIITLSHNAPDRRVFASLDACTKTGSASVETKTPKTTVNITDKNVSDNTVPSPPPK